ncbi:MAG TPA: sigma-70 family RNA polymerase sigma factor, partial [Longimicrobiales bacterium]|nr:sigma-70 family RNA polymerase sigma factor [Longimicrobiales bacterium]
SFVHRYSQLLLHTIHRQSHGYDMAMNRYAFVLEKLQEDEFRRLRRFRADGQARFSTWLVVVTRRICVDYLRSRYGRVRPGAWDGTGDDHALQVRRRLADLLTEELRLDGVPDPTALDPEAELRASELRSALQEEVEALDPRDRLLLKLRFQDDLTGREIAELMEYPTLFHVYRRLKKVLAVLRERLEGRGVEGPRP